MRTYKGQLATVVCGDSLDLYAIWPSPTVIISDGPYGLGGFPGDPPKPEGLGEWYRPHVNAWSDRATPQTTLWFWNSEIGWAETHRLFAEFGWEYRCCHIWNKGIAHIAGNTNGKTLRKFPVTTEVCVQYVKKAFFPFQGSLLPMKEWLRAEWERTGIPLNKTNEACGVRNAATRKYFTQDHLWYMPPPDAFQMIVEYANKHGRAAGRPYFSSDGRRPLTADEWSRMRAKFNFENGVTNVWDEPAVRGEERLKSDSQCIHTNQKPLRLMEMCIRVSSDPGDVVWEPFGGLCTASLASTNLERLSFAAEIKPEFYAAAVNRLEHTNDLFQHARRTAAG